MKFEKEIGLLMILAALHLPCITQAAEEDKELSLIAAEQEKSADGEKLDEINPALTETLTTERTQETDKEIRERKKKLRQTRKEKEKQNDQKLKESSKQRERREESIVIERPQPTPQPQPKPVVEPQPKPQPVVEPQPKPQPVVETPKPQPVVETPKPQPVVETPKPQPVVKTPKPQPVVETPKPQPVVEPPQIVEIDLTAPEPPKPQPKPQPITPPPTKTKTSIPPTVVATAALPNEKQIYANFAEVARAVNFVPLYMPKKSGYEITAIYAGNGVAEIRYGRRWEPTVSLTVRTHKRAPGEQLQDISGVTGVKWRPDTSTGTTIYIAKISDTQQVAAWAVGHYTFSAQAENLSYAGFHSLVADELVELSTHYYLDL